MYPTEPPVLTSDLGLEPAKIEVYVPEASLGKYNTDQRWGMYSFLAMSKVIATSNDTTMETVTGLYIVKINHTATKVSVK